MIDREDDLWPEVIGAVVGLLLGLLIVWPIITL